MKNLKSKFNRLSNYDRPYGSKDNVLMGNEGNKKSAIKIKRLGVDAQGNSIRRVAYAVLMEERERRRNNKTSYNTYITQYPLTPAEAFLKTSGTTNKA